MKYTLDIKRLNEEKHLYLKELFDLPAYYGNTYDSLYDCLSERNDLEIDVLNLEYENEFSLNVMIVFEDLKEEFENISLNFNLN